MFSVRFAVPHKIGYDEICMLAAVYGVNVSKEIAPHAVPQFSCGQQENLIDFLNAVEEKEPDFDALVYGSEIRESYFAVPFGIQHYTQAVSTGCIHNGWLDYSSQQLFIRFASKRSARAYIDDMFGQHLLDEEDRIKLREGLTRI